MSVSTLSPGDTPAIAPPGLLRKLVAVLYRQAGLIAIGALLGGAASAVLCLRQPTVYTSSAKVRVPTRQQGVPGADPANRALEAEIALLLARSSAQAVVDRYAIDDDQLAHGEPARPRPDAAPPAKGRARTVDLFLDGVTVTPLRARATDAASTVLEVRFHCTDPMLAPKALQALLDNYLQLGAQHDRRLGEATAHLFETRLEQARDELGQAQDRIVALLAPQDERLDDAATAASAPALALGLEPAAPARRAAPVAVDAPPPALPLRLDATPAAGDDDPADTHRPVPPPGRSVREDTPLAAQFNRLERARQFAQHRDAELQLRFDEIERLLRLNADEAATRMVVDAPDHPGLADGIKPRGLALLAPAAVGLLLGLLLAARRERGGHRLRSPREAQWALGVPVLGAIPTLSAKAMNTYFEPSTRAPGAGATPPA